MISLVWTPAGSKAKPINQPGGPVIGAKRSISRMIGSGKRFHSIHSAARSTLVSVPCARTSSEPTSWVSFSPGAEMSVRLLEYLAERTTKKNGTVRLNLSKSCLDVLIAERRAGYRARVASRKALKALALWSFASLPTNASAYDMDCKVILCLAGGFPAACSDAYAYMISRLTRTPPLPPFGYCEMSSGGVYTAFDVSARFIGSHESSGYICPEGSNLEHIPADEDGTQEEWFCYTHVGTERYREDGDWYEKTVYYGKTTPNRVNYQIRITVEPGTAQAYSSPTYRINLGTGFVDPPTGW